MFAAEFYSSPRASRTSSCARDSRRPSYARRATSHRRNLSDIRNIRRTLDEEFAVTDFSVPPFSLDINSILSNSSDERQVYSDQCPIVEPTVAGNGDDSPDELEDVSPIRMQVIVAGLWISLFLSSLETTIVSTALIHIADDLHTASSSQWIVVAYLLTYNAFLLITAKLCDTFGVKVMIIAANIWFGLASLGCGFAQTMNQLIILRAFQGIGGSGLYSVVFVILAKIVPMGKIGLYSGILSSVFALASTLGPVLGGLITDHTTWRWIFWLNGPGVVVAMAILIPSVPSFRSDQPVTTRLKEIDVIGGFLSLAWSIPLLFALQEAGAQFAWDSGVIIGTICAGGVAFIVFILYETWLDKREKQQPLFPIKLLRELIPSMLVLNIFLAGASFYVAVIEIPQRLQAVNGESAARAGVLLLPLTLVTPFVSVFTGVIIGKRPEFAEYITLIGTAFVTVAIALLGVLPTTSALPKQQFAWQVMLGVGLGTVIPPLLYILKVEVDENDLASAMGATTMSRTLGGVIGLAICTAIAHSKLTSGLSSILSPTQMNELLQSYNFLYTLPSNEQEQVLQLYGTSYNTQFLVISGFAGANVLAGVGLIYARWRKKRSQGERLDENEKEHSRQ